jgi:Na+-transporting NADH:ubiquinone oxidoreductase subunit NqrD
MSFSVQALEATRLGLLENGTSELSEVLVQHLASSISLHAGQEPCRTVAGPQARAAREGYLRVEWRFACSAHGSIEIVNNAFFAVASSHIHYARVRQGDGRASEFLFTNTERRHRIEVEAQTTSESRGASFGAYLWLGVEHILMGVDHLAFLLALLLLCRRAREVAYLVTGFTLGHSLTLSLAALGVVNPNVPVIEALIGFTIALVAAENVGVTTGANGKIACVSSGALVVLALLKSLFHLGIPLATLVGLALFTGCYLRLVDTPARALRWRPILTVLFGLIHGFGFASVLLEIGLPTDRLIAALLGFNVGVEIGQLGIVAALWLIGLQIARRFSFLHNWFIFDVTSAALCALGLFWFVGRALSV